MAETASTNADVVALALDGAPEGTAVLADHQTSGRGRLDRGWETPAGTSLTVSYLIRPDEVPVVRWPWLPLLVGVAAVDAVTGLAGVQPGLKWPNDVLVGDRKLAGILVERVETSIGAAAVVGVGLNIRQHSDQLPPGGTSLRLELADTTPAPSRDAVLDALGSRLAERYETWRRSGGDVDSATAGEGPIRDAYRERCVTLGRHVRVELPAQRTIEGRAVDVDEAGRLLVATDGGTEALGAGDIVHLRPA